MFLRSWEIQKDISLKMSDYIPVEITMPEQKPEELSEKKWEKISKYNYF